jgi:hypothetical protein
MVNNKIGLATNKPKNAIKISSNLLIIFLSEKNIGTLIQWGGLAIHQFTQLGFNQVLPNTDRF